MGEYWTVKTTDDLVWLIRTERRASDLDDFIRSFGSILERLDGRDPSTLDAVFDLRAAIGRNDDHFEEAIAPHRRKAVAAFRRTAILVRTQAGRLQVTRHFAGEGIALDVFTDEDEVARWLKSDRVLRV